MSVFVSIYLYNYKLCVGIYLIEGRSLCLLNIQLCPNVSKCNDVPGFGNVPGNI